MQHWQRTRIAIFAALSLAAPTNKSFGNDGGSFQQTDIYVSGTAGYHTYRIPAIVATPKGALLGFCEGRKNGASDSGDIDLLLKRSTDGGKS